MKYYNFRGRFGEDWIGQVLKGLHGVLLYIGRMTDMPNHVVQLARTGGKVTKSRNHFL